MKLLGILLVILVAVFGFGVIYTIGYYNGHRDEERLLLPASNDNGDIQEALSDTSTSSVHHHSPNCPTKYSYIDWPDDHDIDSVGDRGNPSELLVWSRNDTLFLQIKDR